MAFDAGLLYCVINEINETSAGGKVEKIYQPTKDELIFLIRGKKSTNRLLMNAGSRCPRISLTFKKTDNPEVAPMLCMLFRKHLQGATFIGAEIVGFDRICRLLFESYDEMGYKCIKTVMYELMGTYSNIILLDGEEKVICAMRYLEISDKNTRLLLPGTEYENPPSQNKINPLEEKYEVLSTLLELNTDKRIDRLILNNYSGISPLISREIAYLSSGNTSSMVFSYEDKISNEFVKIIELLKNGNVEPTIIYDGEKPVEYSFTNIYQYIGFETKAFVSFGMMLDSWFMEKAEEESRGHKAKDIIKFLNSTEARIEKKIGLQRQELLLCDEAEMFKSYGDLIINNIYLIDRRTSECSLMDYETGEYVSVVLDAKLSPSQNAQKYYKKYSKLKSAKNHLTELITSSEHELAYIATVKDSLSRSVSEKEIMEIREELIQAGYSSRIKSKKNKKVTIPTVISFLTTGGYQVFCGKNNLANDWLTFKKASKNDWWFHVKNAPGSHVIMIVPKEEEPSENDFNECCMIAAEYSSVNSNNSVEVDYTKVKNVKKPPNSRPGYVIYHTNWSAVIKINKEKIESMRKN